MEAYESLLVGSITDEIVSDDLDTRNGEMRLKYSQSSNSNTNAMSTVLMNTDGLQVIHSLLLNKDRQNAFTRYWHDRSVTPSLNTTIFRCRQPYKMFSRTSLSLFLSSDRFQ